MLKEGQYHQLLSEVEMREEAGQRTMGICWRGAGACKDVEGLGSRFHTQFLHAVEADAPRIAWLDEWADEGDVDQPASSNYHCLPSCTNVSRVREAMDSSERGPSFVLSGYLSGA